MIPLPLPALYDARTRPAVLVAAALVALFAIGPQRAAADELQDVAKLVARGQYDEAQRRADAFLATLPKDAQMRFLKGVILSQRGQRDAAVGVFTGLTQDYPELPEPYNNLAVIYAAQGRYDDARNALELAVRVSPNDATAHENLGDIYAALAARSYRDARRYDAKSVSSARKLDAVRVLLATPAGAATAATPIAGDRPVEAGPSRAAPAGESRSQRNVGLPYPAGPASSTLGGTLAQTPEIVIPSATTTVPQGSAVVGIEQPAVDAQSATTTLAGSQTTVGVDSSRTLADVAAAVRQWGVQQSLTTGSPNIRIDGDVATARFTSQDRSSPRAAAVKRALTLRRKNGEWVVTDERTE